MIFYDWSGGMESTAMLLVDRERIRDAHAMVRWADTGKQFPEMAAHKAQVEHVLGLSIVTVPRRITFDEFLFERGGMIRKGTVDCSKRMKRGNLARHLKDFPKPWEINLGFNREEVDRADAFIARNERPYCHWRFPLIEADVTREKTWVMCRDAGLTILVGMYEKMGRFDCFMCGNQTPKQALKVVEYYPELAAEWEQMETRNGHSFMPIPIASIRRPDHPLFANITPTSCACFGGEGEALEDIDT